MIVQDELVRHTGRHLLLRSAKSTSLGRAQWDLLENISQNQTGRHCGQFKILSKAR